MELPRFTPARRNEKHALLAGVHCSLFFSKTQQRATEIVLKNKLYLFPLFDVKSSFRTRKRPMASFTH